MERDWIIAPPHGARDALAAAARISPLVAQVLLARGIVDAAAAARFLNPHFTDLLPPAELPGAVEAARRLAAAVARRDKIVIYGDYDVDGITATTILWHALRIAGANVAYYIPSRLEEGYGLNADAIRTLATDGAKVIVTVDCGITAGAEAQLARELGVDLIITDHHQPQGALPSATIVHPTALRESANPHLSGAGVALKVAWALAQELSSAPRVAGPYREFLQDATAFAAIGLIADVVPLLGENRIITRFGLLRLGETKNLGLKTLIDVAGLGGQRRYDDFDIGFKLAPRLNAVGRMGHAGAAVELFTTADAARATEIARELDRCNRDRQQVEQGIVKQAEAMVIERGFHRESCRGIVLASTEWHAGVIGIVASRLVERFHRPTVLIALENGTGQGSGRSVQHFPLHDALEVCGAHLLSYGGHAMAAGVRVTAANIPAFTDAFLAHAAQRLTEQDLRPKLRLDDEVDLDVVTPEIIEHLGRLAPHGPGNARPRFCTTPVELAEPPRTMGRDGAHLQFTVRAGSQFRRAVAFRAGGDLPRLAEQRRIRVAFEPVLNEWNGRRTAELRVLDWQPA